MDPHSRLNAHNLYDADPARKRDFWPRSSQLRRMPCQTVLVSHNEQCQLDGTHPSKLSPFLVIKVPKRGHVGLNSPWHDACNSKNRVWPPPMVILGRPRSVLLRFVLPLDGRGRLPLFSTSTSPISDIDSNFPERLKRGPCEPNIVDLRYGEILVFFALTSDRFSAGLHDGY